MARKIKLILGRASSEYFHNKWRHLISTVLVILFFLPMLFLYFLASSSYKNPTYGVQVMKELYVSFNPLANWESFGKNISYPDRLISFDGKEVFTSAEYYQEINEVEDSRPKELVFRLEDGSILKAEFSRYDPNKNDFLLGFLFPWFTGVLIFLSGLFFYLHQKNNSSFFLMVAGFFAGLWLGQFFDFSSTHMFFYFTANTFMLFVLCIVLAPTILLEKEKKPLKKYVFYFLLVSWIALFCWNNYSIVFLKEHNPTFFRLIWWFVLLSCVRGNILTAISLFKKKEMAASLAWAVIFLIFGISVIIVSPLITFSLHRPVQVNHLLPFVTFIPVIALYSIFIGLKQYNYKLVEEVKEIRGLLVNKARRNASMVLLAGISHEINNPLHGIFGWNAVVKQNIEKLKKIKFKNPEDKKEINRIIEKVVKGSNLIHKFSMSMHNVVESIRGHTKGDLVLKKVDINQEIQHAIDLYDRQIKTKNLKFVFNPKQDAEVKCDVHKIHQVFSNVINNAIFASKDDSNVVVTTNKKTPFLEITVTDFGCGISDEDIERAFDPFYTTKDPGLGMGLGLYICSEILKEHGGSIRIFSIPFKKTDVEIKLPLN